MEIEVEMGIQKQWGSSKLGVKLGVYTLGDNLGDQVGGLNHINTVLIWTVFFIYNLFDCTTI